MVEPKSSEPSRFSTLGWVVVFLLLTILLGVAFLTFRRGEQKSLLTEPPIASVPEFSFTTQEGKTLTKADLLGKIWVVDFIFTSCTGPCPAMTSHMAELASKCARTEDVKFVSVSIDPLKDNPTVLKQYAANVKANPQQWLFLTGPLEKIKEFTTQGMKQSLMVDAVGEPNHSTRFMVVDRKGMLRTVHDGKDPELVQKILIDIGNLLRENSSSQQTKTEQTKTVP